MELWSCPGRPGTFGIKLWKESSAVSSSHIVSFRCEKTVLVRMGARRARANSRAGAALQSVRAVKSPILQPCSRCVEQLKGYTTGNVARQEIDQILGKARGGKKPQAPAKSFGNLKEAAGYPVMSKDRGTA